MASEKQGALDLLKQTFQEWSQDDCSRLAAALAYYTIFAVPSILTLVILIAGSIIDEQAITGQIEAEIAEYVGTGVAQNIETMIQSAGEQLAGGSLFATLLSLGGLIVGATGAFFQLQRALNNIWSVEPDPEGSAVMSFLWKRFLSFLMILAIGFLAIVFVVISPVIAGLGEELAGVLPGGLSHVFLWVVDVTLSLTVFTVLFAATFKILPDAEIGWRQVWVGSFVTAVLFVLGKWAMAIYLGTSSPGDVFGAAGWLAIMLLYVFIATNLFFLGAEFTQVWARRQGHPIVPEEGAVRVVEVQKKVLEARDGSVPSTRREPTKTSS